MFFSLPSFLLFLHFLCYFSTVCAPPVEKSLFWADFGSIPHSPDNWRRTYVKRWRNYASCSQQSRLVWQTNENFRLLNCVLELFVNDQLECWELVRTCFYTVLQITLRFTSALRTYSARHFRHFLMNCIIIFLKQYLQAPHCDYWSQHCCVRVWHWNTVRKDNAVQQIYLMFCVPLVFFRVFFYFFT